MRKNRLKIVSKALLVILCTVLMFHFIVWKFISTDTFGRYLSSFLNNYLSQYTQISIKYDKLSAKLFPPGLVITNLEVKTLAPFEEINSLKIFASQVDIDTRIFTVTWDKLQISNIELSNLRVEGDISESILKSKKNKNDPWQSWKFINLQNLFSFGMVDIFRVGINNGEIKTNLIKTKIPKVSWEKLGQRVEFFMDIKDVDIEKKIVEDKIDNKKLINYFTHLEYLQFETTFNKKNIEINNFKAGLFGQNATATITIDNPYKRELKYNSEFIVNINHDIASANTDFPWRELIIKQGFNSFNSKSKIKIQGDLNAFKIKANSDIDSLKSKYINLDFSTIEWQLNDSLLSIDSILCKDFTGGVAKFKTSKIIFDVSNAKIKNLEAVIQAESVDINNALGILPSVAKSLRGSATGEIGLDFAPDSEKISIKTINNLKIKEFKLFANTKEILKLEKVDLKDATFVIGNGVTMKGKMLMGSSEVDYQGTIDSQNILVKTSLFDINFDELKSIAGIKTEGKGKASLIAEGETKNPKLTFNLQNIEHTNIFGLYFGNLSGNITIDFIRDAIFFNNIQSKLNPGRLSGDGYISLNDFSTDISIKTTDLSSLDLIMIHKSLIPWDLSFMEKVISTSSITYKIGGQINSLKDLVVRGDIKTQRVTWGSEEIYDLNATLLFKDKIITVPNLDFMKGKGKLTLGLSYDLDNQLFRLAFKSKNLEASDLFLYKKVNPSFSSAIHIEGAYKSSKTTSEGVLNILATDSMLSGEYIDDSYLAAQWKDGLAKVQGKYGNNWIKLNSLFDFNQTINDKINKSFATVSVNVPDWGKIFNMFSSFDSDDPVLKGKLNVEVDTLFNVKQPFLADIDFWIKDLSLTHSSLQIRKTEKDRIVIDKGEIKKWDIVIKGLNRDQLISRAFGHIGRQAEIENVFDFSLGKLNYFLGSYLDLNGFMQSQLKVRLNNKEITYLGRIKSEDMILNSKELVSSLGKTRLVLEYDNKEIRLVQLQSQMGAGTFSMTGNVNWTTMLYPALTFRYSFNNAKIQLASRTMGIIGGQGLIIGTQPPYIIGGDLKLIQSELFNEFSDFAFAKQKKQNSVKYLPSQVSDSKADLFLLNTSIVTDSPLVIRNSVAEINLLANVNLSGKVSDPRMSGQVYIKNDKRNVFILKNNNFKINRLNVIFDNRQPISNPSLDIDAESFISNYIVRAKVYGSMKDYQLDLTSDPALSRQSILSLIAFGYAENLSENMSNEDREALSSAGLGAFIFDQLKLNERLHSNLGLTLNVGTEYLSNSSSLLQGRTQQAGSSTVGQVRTATKLELRKKIDDRVGVTVSSTVGGSAGQKQAMNLNYYVNKNLSLDALYELNTDFSDGQERAGSSAGGDVKFKWTFK